MLELALGAATVASGWSQYLQVVLTSSPWHAHPPAWIFADHHNLAAAMIVLVLAGLAIGLIPGVPHPVVKPDLVLFAFLFSFGDGINSVTWALVGDFFGRTHFGTIRGWISMCQSIASIPAAVLTGWIYDRTQSYTWALIPFIAAYAVAGLILWRLPQPERPGRRAVALTAPAP